MKHLTLAALAVASLAGTAEVASAQPWGGGYYDDGGPRYRCRYRESDYDYDRDRYYRRRDYGESRGYRTQSGCRAGLHRARRCV
jgi:hypothetical protein